MNETLPASPDPPPLRVGSVVVDPPVVLAPMAGLTTSPFRRLCREAGCGLVVSPLLSAYAIVYDNAKTRQLMRYVEDERPVAVQLFGADSRIVSEAARRVEQTGVDLLDLNMGCPVRKTTKTGAGCALMRDPGRAAVLAEAVVGAVSIPVTVKTRLGWNQQERTVEPLARRLEAAGIAALTVHGRYGSQGYRGRADWAAIGRVKAGVTIPVIGNGDVRTPEDAAALRRQTGCDGVMIGRAAAGDPALFTRVAHYLRTGELLPPPPPAQRIETALRHARLLSEWTGEYLAVLEMRHHLAAYLRGLPRASRVRRQVHQATTLAEIEERLLAYRDELTRDPAPAGRASAPEAFGSRRSGRSNSVSSP